MARLRFNNVSSRGGTNTVSLPASGTTATWVSAPAFPTIAAPDYAAVIVDPDTAAEEIVYVTAYTAAATTATVTRAQEGTSQVVHSGALWAHGPTALDVRPYYPYMVVYNSGTASWPARPSTSDVPAGMCIYTSADATAADPADTQNGDIVYIPDSASVPVFSAANPPDGVNGVAYTYTFAASNTPTGYTVLSGALPTGLTLDATSGILSGTPSVTATFTFVVRATNAVGTTDTGSTDIVIAAAASAFSLANAPGGWSGASGNSTPTADAGIQHAASGSSLKQTVGVSAQVYASLSHTISGITPLSVYSMPANWVYGTHVSRKASVSFTWQTSGFATIRTDYDDADVTLANASWVTGPAKASLTAPATSAYCVVTLNFLTTDGSNLPTGEAMYWSFT